MLHNERKKLVEIKRLMTTLRGDFNWLPCGAIELRPEPLQAKPRTNSTIVNESAGKSLFDIDIQPEDIEKIRIINGQIVVGESGSSHTGTNGEAPLVKAERIDTDAQSLISTAGPSALPIPEPLSIPPLQTAEESKRLLTAIVQKQTEVVQSVSQLYNNLSRAKRLKETVWLWCRAEAHVDEMSDGEDWIDLEEWGLDEMLTKGAEEGLGMGNGGDDPEILARKAEVGTGGGSGRGRRRGAQ